MIKHPCIQRNPGETLEDFLEGFPTVSRDLAISALEQAKHERLRLSFPSHDCVTARFAGFAGIENGQLLGAAEAAGFDVFTVDRNIPTQRNSSGRKSPS
jgi:hypothetical protein